MTRGALSAPTYTRGPTVLGQPCSWADAALSTELAALATELNQPDLMYKFMSLAAVSATWNSRKGAAFGFASIAAKAGEQVGPVVVTAARRQAARGPDGGTRHRPDRDASPTATRHSSSRTCRA